MHEAAGNSHVLTAIPAESPRKGRPLLAWAVILLAVAALFTARSLLPEAKAAAASNRLARSLFRVRARYLVGFANLPGQNGKQLYPHLGLLKSGSVDERLRYVTLAGELAGPEEARRQLAELRRELREQHEPLSREQRAVLAALARLYRAYAGGQLDASSIPAEQRARLRADLGWFGALALNPAGGSDPAARRAVLRPAFVTLFAFFAAFGFFGLLGILGLLGLVLFLVGLFLGWLQSGVVCGSAHGAVYAETFALWMVLFIALDLAGSQVNVGSWRLLTLGAAQVLSLAALAWPVVRGIPWRRVRLEIGWTAGRQPLLEPALGIGGYAMALPLVAVGVLIAFLILLAQAYRHGQPGTEFSPLQPPIHHPIEDFLAAPTAWTWVQLVLVASVGAPLVEETMFRGVLYRHLREASCRLRFPASVLLSAALVSFLFAAIHPQGLLAVPALMGLAFSFNLVREWRGTLLPCMVAHGLNNGVVTLLLFLILSY